jgi:septal ring factor EnvC (AmiA/AmiB activator)
MSTSSSACAGCRERDTLIKQLQSRLAEVEAESGRLRRELESTRREQTRQANRFRRRNLKKRRKKPGRKTGHPAAVRPTPKPNALIATRPCMTAAR